MNDAGGSFDQVTVEEALERAIAGTLLIDISEQWEWERAHCSRAIHMPMSTIGDRLGEIPEDADVLIMCQSGARSFSIATALAERGYRAIDVLGGMAAWRRSGLPVALPADLPAEHDPGA